MRREIYIVSIAVVATLSLALGLYLRMTACASYVQQADAGSIRANQIDPSEYNFCALLLDWLD